MTSYSDVPPEYSEEGYIFNADTWKSGTDKSSSSSSTTNGDFYVNKGGDIMTGNLIVPSINTSIITFGDSSTMDTAPNTASIEETATKTTAISYDGNTTISSMLKLTSNTSTQLQIYNQNATNLMNISGLSNSFYFHNMSSNSTAGIYYQINGSSRLSIFPTYIESSGYITIPTETAGSSNNRVANTQFVSDALQALQNNVGNPVGSIIQGLWATEPIGYLFCIGQEVSISTYSALYNVLGTMFNSQFGEPTSGNFRLPDLRATFLRCVGNSSLNTNWQGGTLGVYGRDKIASHRHTFNRASGTINVATSVGGDGVRDNNENTSYTGSTIINANDVGNLMNDVETRPFHLAVNYAIKF